MAKKETNDFPFCELLELSETSLEEVFEKCKKVTPWEALEVLFKMKDKIALAIDEEKRYLTAQGEQL